MRSPDSRRALGEYALRGIALAAMIALTVRLWLGTTPQQATVVVSSASVDSALASWTTAPPEQAVLRLVRLPVPAQRDWLRALQRTGLLISWRADDSTAVAIVAEAGALPQHPIRAAALGGEATTIELADDLGAIDSANTGDHGVATWSVSPVGRLTATMRSAAATSSPRDSLIAKPVLVVGQAGWEVKFVTAALEESGWSVSTRMTLAPGAVVRQGSTAAIDTTSFSAIVVLDSTSELASATITRFVAQGGGLIASGSGANHPALRAIIPRATSTLRGELGAIMGPRPREGLHARRMRVDRNAVALEQRGNAPVVVARRVGAGRVAAVGYDDTWRVRLGPPDESAPDVHRAWWSSLVGSVARVSLVRRVTGPIDEAPLAATVNALGDPLTDAPPSPTTSLPWTALLASLAAVALLAEWLSRRLRGVA